MTNRAAQILFVLAVSFAAGGAQCHRPNPNVTAIYGPRVLTENPSTGDVIQAVNANSALIKSLFTTDAVMSVPGAPSLRANLALERQKKFRLRAETALTGAEVDMGSNDELFWFWVRRNPPPTLYFCRHDRFESSAAKQIVPVDPEWLLDALGLVTFEAYHQHSIPTKNRNGKWEIRTTMTNSSGAPPMSKVTVVDEARGFVLEQHLYDPKGVLVASAITSRHWRDPASGAIVPQAIEINWPSTHFNLKFDVRTWSVNNLQADPAQLFAMPSFPGWAVVDLGDPNFRPGVMPATTPVSGPASSPPTGAAPTTSVPATGVPAAGSSAPIPTPTPYSNSGGFGASRAMTPTPDAVSTNVGGSTFQPASAGGIPYGNTNAYGAAPVAGRDLIGFSGPSAAPIATNPNVAPPGGYTPATIAANRSSTSPFATSPFPATASGINAPIRSAQAAPPPAAPGMLR